MNCFKKQKHSGNHRPSVASPEAHKVDPKVEQNKVPSVPTPTLDNNDSCFGETQDTTTPAVGSPPSKPVHPENAEDPDSKREVPKSIQDRQTPNLEHVPKQNRQRSTSLPLLSGQTSELDKGPYEKSHFNGDQLDDSLAPLKLVLESPWCGTHRDKMLELYCEVHKGPICLLCASTTHRSCWKMRTLQNVLRERRKELDNITKALRDQETALVQQRNQLEDIQEMMRMKTDQVANSAPTEKKPALKDLPDRRRLPPRSKTTGPAARASPPMSQPTHSSCYPAVRATQRVAPHTPAGTVQPSTAQNLKQTNSSPIMWIGVTACPGASLSPLPSPAPH